MVSISTARLCLAELKEHVSMNRELSNLKNSVERFVMYQKHVLPKPLQAELEDKNFDNVALLVQLFPIISALPPDRCEWFMGKVDAVIEDLAAELNAPKPETDLLTEDKTS
jgi:hypothetical protein